MVGGFVLLTFVNGANDIFKGVATLFGGGVASYRTALAWAIATTVLGCLAAYWVAGGLAMLFSGKGVVPDAIVGNPAFLAAATLAAGSTVLLATRLGIPVSTTHALVGGLMGAGAAAAPGLVAYGAAATRFAVPLAVSPLIPVVLVGLVVPMLAPVVARATEAWRWRAAGAGRRVFPGTGTSGDALHFLSAGIVGFARGMNDTPKLVGIIMFLPLIKDGALGTAPAFVAAAVLMAAGAFQTRRVAETLSRRITPIRASDGAMANATTSALVVGASVLALPVSTTHVSVGAIFGLGVASGKADLRILGTIVGAWCLTLPLAAGLGALAWLAFEARF